MKMAPPSPETFPCLFVIGYMAIVIVAIIAITLLGIFGG